MLPPTTSVRGAHRLEHLRRLGAGDHGRRANDVVGTTTATGTTTTDDRRLTPPHTRRWVFP